MDLRLVFATLALTRFLGAQIELTATSGPMYALPLQRMRGVEQALDIGFAVFLLAARDEGLGELQIVENARRVSERLEGLVVLEEVIVSEGGVRDDERLHRRRVALHYIRDTGIRVDDDLVRETHHALAVHGLVLGEVFSE